jgi:hypothetical protein
MPKRFQPLSFIFYFPSPLDVTFFHLALASFPRIVGIFPPFLQTCL